MKLTFGFFLLSIHLMLASQTYAQSTTITLDVVSAPISEVLEIIEKETDFQFFYNSRIVNVNEKVSVKANRENVFSVLDQLFQESDVQYRVIDRDIILTVAEKNQQQRSVRGVITDNYGDPVIGANVVEKGTLNGTITDVEGNFQLQTADGAVLQITYIGYLSQEIPVNNRSVFEIQLVEDTQKLEEVVVVGYGTQKKVNLTGSIVAVKTEDINNIPSSNLSNSLAGRAPGVTITTTSGMAGGSSTIRMRGSFGEPLFVINNVIRDKAAFDALDPNEVDNISFLKDAASASIYGSRAGNGVVLVTTKNGKNQKPEFQYKGSVSTSRTTKPVQSYTATDELIYANRVAETLGQPQVYDPNGEIFEYFKDKSYDVNDYVWRNPSSTQHNLSVNGGNERISYFMLVGYHDENGSYKNLDYQKYNFRSDITAHISSRFKVNFNLSGNQRNYNRFYWPYDEMDNFNVPDFYRATFNWTRLYPFYVDDAGNPTTDTNANPVSSGSHNPVEMVLGNHYQKETRRTMDGQIRFDLDLGQFVEGLTTSLLGQYTAYDRNLKAFITHNKSYRFKSASATNPFLPGQVDPNDMVIHNLGSTYEGIKETMDMNNFYQLNWFLKYDRRFGKHAVSGLLVYEQSESSNKRISGEAYELLTSSIDQIYVTSNDAQRRNFSGREQERASQSVVGRFNYTYDDKYIAEFSFREDGNARFAPGYRWGFFPSGSLAWRISEEKFMHKVKWLTNLKLRGSYGTTGDDLTWDGKDEVSYFLWRSSYGNSSNTYIFGDNLQKTIKLNGTANPYLTWAKLEVFDIGLDFGLFDHRLTGEFDYFVKTKSNILKSRNKEVPSTYGASLNEENYAKQQWHGSEISMRWSDRYNKLNYSVYANMGYVKDKWLIMDEEDGLKDWQSAIGRPNSRLYGYIAEGIIRTQEELDALPEGFTQFGRRPILGTILFRDIRGEGLSEGADGKIDENDKTYLSEKGTPRINYGFGFNLEWKGITLDAHFQGVGAYDRMIATKNGDGVFQMDRPYFELWAGDVWTPENPGAKYPRVAAAWDEPEYGAAGSSFWIRNGAYLRLKNLNIGYSLPAKWYAKSGVKNIQLFFNATNLFYITAIKEMDPEQSTLDSYPLMKSFTGGLSINF